MMYSIFKLTFVTPIAPTFSPKVLVPFPDPQRPASTVPRPSVPKPRLMACSGGGGAAVGRILLRPLCYIKRYRHDCKPKPNICHLDSSDCKKKLLRN